MILCHLMTITEDTAATSDPAVSSKISIRQLFQGHMSCAPDASISPQPGLKLSSGRQMFSADEDEHLKQLVSQFGNRDWKTIAKKMPNRTTRQCRERYKNYLSPELSNLPWSSSEDVLLREQFAKIGPKWATIATFFSGRSDVSLKNRWATLKGRNEPTQPSLAEAVTAPDAEPKPPPVPARVVEPSPAVPQSDGFRIAQLMWSQPEKPNGMRKETKKETDKHRDTFLNYGGDIW
jgi:hypothetical protein